MQGLQLARELLQELVTPVDFESMQNGVLTAGTTHVFSSHSTATSHCSVLSILLFSKSNNQQTQIFFEPMLLALPRLDAVSTMKPTCYQSALRATKQLQYPITNMPRSAIALLLPPSSGTSHHHRACRGEKTAATTATQQCVMSDDRTGKQF